jgi:hypothetical protein
MFTYILMPVFHRRTKRLPFAFCLDGMDALNFSQNMVSGVRRSTQ